MTFGAVEGVTHLSRTQPLWGIGDPHYDDTYSPTFRAATLRTTLAAAGIEDMELHSVDISAAFTNGDLEGSHLLCRLKKSLYGLKQAARQWNKKLHSVLLELGFTRLQSDRSVYIYTKGEVRIIMPVYIDNITLASQNTALLSQTFLLGVEIICDRANHSISLSQRQYIIDMLERYSMADCNPVGTPLAPGTKLSKTMHPQTQEEIDYMRTVPYLSAVGSLNYLSTMTRLDISYAVGYLGRFSSNPGPRHWATVKHLFRYLKGSMDYKLTYSGKDTSVVFDTYCDASHGDCLDSGRSTGGYLTVIGRGAIGWLSKLQPIVALSSTEAEYMVATEAAKSPRSCGCATSYMSLASPSMVLHASISTTSPLSALARTQSTLDE
ncbi:hypothetical protein EST38_g7548 [Candolleomyces aberdarensis]|uniref:Reverse transcriptase Ty1/copia-type domain-containing protein n=1 Tax=Candolleomyces aberdarensis TaxID=2316362 RepID=A0A4Q2DEV5_9AGAR|nr:hypothetical protein EST38_g7548 [Candolleomyces aberdarensis]